MTIGTTELRMYLGERIPTNGLPEDTLFTDEELATVISRGGGLFYLTLGHGWNAKAGILSELIDVAEDGSVRNLSKRYEQAARQAQSYYKLAVAENEALASEIPPVVGRGFDAYLPPKKTAAQVFYEHPVAWP